MHIIFNAKTLSKSLKAVGLVVERRSTIPILSNVAIQIEKSHAKITATNLNTEIVSYAEIIEVSEDFGITIPFKTLNSFAAFCGDIPMKIEIIDQAHETLETKAIISAGEDDFKVSCVALELKDFPFSPAELTFEELETFTNGRFGEILSIVCPAISTEETRYYLNGVCFHNGAAVATDGHRLIEHIFNREATNSQFIIPRHAISALQKLNPKQAKLSICSTEKQSYKWFRIVSSGQFIMTGKLIDGTFPEYKRVIPTQEAKGRFVIADGADFRKKILFMKSLLAVDAQHAGKTAVKFSASEALELCMSAENLYTKRDTFIKTSAKVEAVGSDPLPWIGFNINYVMRAIKPQGETVFEIIDSGSPARITNSLYPDTLTVLMPMRI